MIGLHFFNILEFDDDQSSPHLGLPYFIERAMQ